MIDISMDLDENTVVWVDDEKPKLVPIARKPKAPVNFTWLNFSAHAGTHIDAPYYLFEHKWKSNEVPLNILNGDCQVIDLTNITDMITKKDLEKKKILSKRVLLKTKNSFDNLKEYNPKHISLSVDGAEYLRDLKIELVGFDYQSFEREGKTEIHSIFMKNNIICLDNLRLGKTSEKIYTLLCLPIKVIGIDAAPARAILLEDKNEF